jgi:hypothetical protein
VLVGDGEGTGEGAADRRGEHHGFGWITLNARNCTIDRHY